MQFQFHFGLEPYVAIVLYLAMIAAFLGSIFRSSIIGIYFLLPLIPLQTIRYRLAEYPLGASVVGVMFLGVILGLLREGKPIFRKTPFTGIIVIYGAFTFFSLCLGSFSIDRPLPLPGDPRFGVWQEYMMMPALLLIVAAVAPTKRQLQIMIVVMCLATLSLNKNFWNTVSDRDFSSYSDDLRDEGGMGYAGTNGLAAFEAQSAALLLALASFEKRTWPRLGYQALALFSAVCLMYSLSRGGYVAFFAGWLILGLLRERKLLALLVVFLFTWTVVTPPAVQERVMMTYDEQNGSLDNSSATRFSLWENAMQVFQSNPVTGSGFNTYAYMHLNKRTDGGSGFYEDTHNYYIKVLAETGIVGLLIFLALLAQMCAVGFRLFRTAEDPLLASIGLGLVGWLVCSVVANFFGDRWTFLQVNGYLWLLGGMASQALALEKEAAECALEPESLSIETTTEDSQQEVEAVAQSPLAALY
jgi:putative inorganic carbon (hco3(-)) transporter